MTSDTGPPIVRMIEELVARGQGLRTPNVRDYVAGGSGTEQAIVRNRASLDELAIVPRVLRDVRGCDTSTTFLGLPLALPVMVAPIGGIHYVHASAALGLARGASDAGTVAWVSSAATPTFQTIADATDGPLVCQLYIEQTLSDTWATLERALDSGAELVCLTVDTAVSAQRTRDLRNRFDPRERPMPNITQLAGHDSRAGISWDHVSRLRDRVPVPLVLKGTLHPEDARQAAPSGSTVPSCQTTAVDNWTRRCRASRSCLTSWRR